MFSDGVLAIAITLLVLELPFDKVCDGELGHALGDHWARFAAYGLSFIGIGILWLHHHAIFTAVGHADRGLVLLNMIVLFCAAFLPYPTSLVGDYLSAGGSNARGDAALQRHLDARHRRGRAHVPACAAYTRAPRERRGSRRRAAPLPQSRVGG